jgi:hypothetical protein
MGLFYLTTYNMAIIIFKSKQSPSKPKKEHIDLSLEHKKAKKSSQFFKIAFSLSIILNVFLFLHMFLAK